MQGYFQFKKILVLTRPLVLFATKWLHLITGENDI